MDDKDARAACRRVRERLGLTLDDIACEWDYCDPAAISRWERNKKKSLPGLRSAAEYKALLDRLAKRTAA